MNTTAPTKIKFYGYFRSSCSFRLRWALEYKGLAYEEVKIHLLKGEQNDPSYIKKNPAGFVPALELDGICYGESLAILEYLEEQFPTPALLPQDSLSRLQVRQLALSIVAGTQPLQNLQVKRLHSNDTAEQSRWCTHWITRGLATYEKLLEQTPPGTYSIGHAITFADLCLVPQCTSALREGIHLEQFPLLYAVYSRCLTLPSCQNAFIKED